MIDPELKRDALVAATDRTVRQFAALSLLLFGALAVSDIFRGHSTRGVCFAALAVAIGVAGLVRPATIRPVFQGAMAVAMPIGWVTSHILLALIYYLVFTPLAVLSRLTGRDALRRRRYRPRGDTYWAPKPRATDLRSYLRQS